MEEQTAQARTVEKMTTEEEISRNEYERNEARQDLRVMLNEVNAKLDRAGEDFRPDHLVANHPVAASLVGSAVGFFTGSTVKSRVIGPIAIAVLLGIAISKQFSRQGLLGDQRKA
jgi:hypothetical protein